MQTKVLTTEIVSVVSLRRHPRLSTNLISDNVRSTGFDVSDVWYYYKKHRYSAGILRDELNLCRHAPSTEVRHLKLTKQNKDDKFA